MEEVKKAVEVEVPKTIKRYILIGRYTPNTDWYCFGQVDKSPEELINQTSSYNYIERKIFEIELPLANEIDI